MGNRIIRVEPGNLDLDTKHTSLKLSERVIRVFTMDLKIARTLLAKNILKNSRKQVMTMLDIKYRVDVLHDKCQYLI